MALSAAEKQRRYRQRRDADPEKRQKFLQSKKEKYIKDKSQGKKKLVKDMTPREHRIEKKRWKKRQRECREQKHLIQQQETPPTTPQDGPSPPPEPSHAVRRIQNRKRKQTEKKQLKREIANLQNCLEKQQKRAQMYKKRCQRLTQKLDDTPRSKSQKLLRKSRKDPLSKKTVRKTLVFHYTLLEQIKQNYKNRKTSIKDVVAGEILRKYHFKTQARHKIGCSPYNYKKKKGCLSSRVKASVQSFYLRDDNSRILPGKRKTITKRKIKKQRRVLCDYLRNLYLKYKAESLETISFITFWRLRPFWVTYPRQSDRDTCLCKTCENTQYMAESLFKLNVIETANLGILTQQMVCSTDKKGCMYRECNNCRNKKVQGSFRDATKEVSWTQWETVKEERTLKNGEKKMITITVNAEKNGTVSDLWDKFHEQMTKYCPHSFNIQHQYKHYRYLRENMGDNECLVHVDFAENYIGKLHKEIQSVHFGASQRQITLHTGCYFTKRTETPVLFCGVSDSLQHDPSAVWAYLRTVLKEIKTNCPGVDTVHFFSDGPTTQYRQKINFYFFSTEIYKMGFVGGTWNFMAAGHGKGIPDGVGAAVKRAADNRVLHGADILNSKTLVKELAQTRTSINLYVISEDDIKVVEKQIKNKTLKTVPGTMKLHQLILVAPMVVKWRDVSCTCIDTPCPDHIPREFVLAPWGSEDTTGSKRKREEASIKETIHTAAKKTKPEDNATNTTPTTEKEFSEHLDALHNCHTFQELKQKCSELTLPDIDKPKQLSTEKSKFSVDPKARHIYPPDVPGPPRVPVKVRADGDCLPGCASMFAYGNDSHAAEMRVRIIHELALHEEYYLNKDNLSRGLATSDTGKVINSFYMYSPEYIPGTKITDRIIRSAYEKEVMKITKAREYMGMWQLCAVSSILKSPVFSVHPQLGNPIVRCDLHRLILPRLYTTCTTPPGCQHDDQGIPVTPNNPLVIMWTTTREDMTNEHWNPNHFVAAVPETPGSVGEQSSRPMPDQIFDVPPPDECQGQWVLVQYDRKPYPGVVVDADGEEVYVECMNAVGKGLNNIFFWPKTYQDVCWYDHDKIMAVIPKPVRTNSAADHFAVDEAIWRAVVGKLKG